MTTTLREQDGDGRVTRRVEGHVLVLTLDRPAKRNAFTPRMFADLAEGFTLLENDPNLRCACLTAAGEHFTAGLDLPSIAPLRREGRPLIPDGQIDPFALREPIRRKPLVVAFKGISFTTAVSLALAAEVNVAASNCRFAILEVAHGIMAGLGATFLMPLYAGWGGAMRYVLTADEFDADTAMRMNIVQHVVAPGEEEAMALQIAHRIASRAPLAVQASMQNARDALAQGWPKAYAEVADIQRQLYNSDDAKEGVQAFKERRKPVFTGR